MQIAFVLDVIIAVLLVLTITYAVRLNQRLGQLRSDKNELLELAKTFAEATVKAESGIKSLKISSEALQNDMKKAEALRDDLVYLVERGGRSADEMVASVRAPKAQHPAGDDFSPTEDDDLLIQEAIRAATSDGGKRPKRRMAAQGAKTHEREQGRTQGRQQDRAQDRGETTRRVSSHPVATSTAPERAPQTTNPLAPNPAASEPVTRKLGGGLGGLSSEDRLLEKHASHQEPDSIGDTDAARELLKALSSMK